MDGAAESLWRFSLAVYARPGVAAACLSLQERRGVDVNLLLYLLWRVHDGRGRPGRAAIRQAMRSVAAWHGDVVKPLRAVRRTLKPLVERVPGAESLRTEVKRAELDSERLEQSMLAALAPPRGRRAPHGAAAEALVEYLAILGRTPTRRDLADLAIPIRESARVATI